MPTPLSIAAAYLERSYPLGEGHRFTLDPHEQESASGSAIIRAHHEYFGIPVMTDDIAVHIDTSGDATTAGEPIDTGWECASVPTVAVAAGIEHFRLRVGIGQSIYTPSIITKVGAQPFDRPWAGWLYTSAILNQTPRN
jgi:hypothetical protein